MGGEKKCVFGIRPSVSFCSASANHFHSGASQCMVRRKVWVAKDSPRTTAGQLQKIVESRAQKALNKMVKQHLHHHMLFGRVSRKIILAHPKTNYSIFSYQTRLELRMGLASTVRWNKKNCFLAANTQDGFGKHGDKKYPICRKYICIFDVVGLYFCWRSWTACLDTWHHEFYQIPTDKKFNNWLTLSEIL